MSGTMKTRAVVVEDEPIARARLRDLLADVEWIEWIGEAADGASAVTTIDELKPDLVFLDIEMPEASGLEVLRRIRHDPAIVFTTAYDKFAVAAFELEAIDYLLKPFGRDRLLAALERVRRSLVPASEGSNEPVARRARAAMDQLAGAEPMLRIFVRDHGRILPIAVADIERLEADDDYVAVYRRGRRYLVYLGMNEFEARLDPQRFLRIHRSHIVNLDHVAAMNPYDRTRLQIQMKDGTKLMASRVRSRELRGLAI
jgi:two-component system LytT family response regulator